MIGTWVGIGVTTISFAVLGSQPFAGRLLVDHQGRNYVPMQLFVGFMLLGGTIFYAIARLMVSKGL